MADNSEDIERIKIDVTAPNADNVTKQVADLGAAIDVTTEKSSELAKSNKAVTESQSKVAKSTGEQAAGFEDLGGGIGSAITQTKELSKQFLKLLANPIVLFITAVVGALTLLYKAFTSTKEGGEQMERIFAGLGAVMDVLRDRVLKIGGAITKFISGDFKGAIKDGKAAVSGFGDEVAREFQQAADAAGELQKVADATRDLGVQRAKLNRDLAASEYIITSETASYKEKLKAINEVGAAEAKQTAAELANAKRRLEAIKTQNALSDSNAEALDKEYEAQKIVYELEQKSAEDRRKIADFRRQADSAEQARVKAINDERKRVEKERSDARKKELEEIAAFNKSIKDLEKNRLKELQDLNAQTEQEKLDLRKQRDAEELELLRQKGADITALQAYNQELYATKQAEIDAANLEAKKKADLDFFAAESDAAAARAAKEKEIADKRLAQKEAEQTSIENLANAGINAAKGLFEKNKGVQKAAIIADGAVSLAKVGQSTIEAVSKDNAASPLTFGLPWSAVHIATGALGAANIISSTQKALQALGGGGSIGSAPNITTARGAATPAAAAATPQTGFQASSENQIATSVQNAQSALPPIKTYVVSSDVTTAQDLDNKLIQENSFG